ncbi:MAG: FG-GAP-like repeat-containing protein [Ignavibacteriales bacterium]|nr:FG-GAP-like repeat-containing protein [Ignavibacteriales bacterium]
MPILRSVKEFDRSLELLKRFLARQLVYAGEVEQAAFLFSDDPLLLTIPAETVLTPFELLELGLHAARELKHPALGPFTEFLRAWKERTRSAPSRTIFPAVEKPLVAAGQQSTGRLRGVSVELFGETKNGSDDLRADVAMLPEGEQDFVLPAFAAVRTLIADMHPNLVDHFYSGRIRFDDLTALHEGSSANLAIAAITYCEILRYSNQRTVFQLSSRAAFTGGINESGEVLPVEPATLVEKIKAAVFSPVDFLVIPRQQLAEAQRLTRDLEKSYPRRNLVLVVLGNLRDVFVDRRLSALLVVGPVRHLGKMVWRRKPFVLALGVVAVLLLVIARLWFGPVDRRPSYTETVGEELLVKNAFGAVLDAVHINRATADAAAQHQTYLSLSALVDVNGDGKPELIWAEANAERSAETSFVACKIVGTDTILWRHEVRNRFSFPKNRDAEAGGYGITDLVVDDVDGDRQPDVFFAAQNPMFCSIVVRLDARTGKEIDCYLNIGHIIDLLLMDLKNTGKPMLIGCGVNNAFGRGCMVVLDPSRMSGHSPLQGDYVVDGLPLGREVYYLLAPRSSLAEIYSETVHNNAQSIEKIRGGGILWTVRDFFVHKNRVEGFVRFHLDTTMHFRQAGSNNEWGVFRRKALSENLLPVVAEDEYLRQLGNNILYWDGGGWQKTAVMNRRYSEVVGNKE